MRPDYEQRYQTERKLSGGPLHTVAVRMPKIFWEKLQTYAEGEDSEASELVREGVMRLFDDREQDPEYMNNLPPSLRAKLGDIHNTRINELEQALERAKAQRASLGEIQTDL